MNTANDSGTSSIPAMPRTVPMSWGENPNPPKKKSTVGSYIAMNTCIHKTIQENYAGILLCRTLLLFGIRISTSKRSGLSHK